MSIDHFFKFQIEALYMHETLSGLVNGNIDGSKLPNTLHASAGVGIRAN